MILDFNEDEIIIYNYILTVMELMKTIQDRGYSLNGMQLTPNDSVLHDEWGELNNLFEVLLSSLDFGVDSVEACLELAEENGYYERVKDDLEAFDYTFVQQITLNHPLLSNFIKQNKNKELEKKLEHIVGHSIDESGYTDFGDPVIMLKKSSESIMIVTGDILFVLDDFIDNILNLLEFLKENTR